MAAAITWPTLRCRARNAKHNDAPWSAVFVTVFRDGGQWWQPQAEPHPPPDGAAAADDPLDGPVDEPTLANTESRRTESS